MSRQKILHESDEKLGWMDEYHCFDINLSSMKKKKKLDSMLLVAKTQLPQ